MQRYKHFKKGQTSTEDNEHSGQPSTSKNEEHIQKVRKVNPLNAKLNPICHLLALINRKFDPMWK
jgi:hypothetical protein